MPSSKHQATIATPAAIARGCEMSSMCISDSEASTHGLIASLYAKTPRVSFASPPHHRWSLRGHRVSEALAIFDGPSTYGRNVLSADRDQARSGEEQLCKLEACSFDS